jgi:hypothetical protein
MKSKKFVIALGVLIIMAESVLGRTISIAPNQVNIIRPSANEVNSALGPRILIKFNLPREIYQTETGYAEMVLPLYLPYANGDSLVGFEAYILQRDWTENSGWNNPWRNAGGDFDTTMKVENSVFCGNNNLLKLDMTEFVKTWVSDSTTNYGIIIIPRLQNLNSFRAFPNITGQIRSSVNLKIILPE